MKILVQGTQSFGDYNVFLRSMGVALSGMKSDDADIFIYSLGPEKVSSFAFEFINVSEPGMKSRGKKAKIYHVENDWAKENVKTMDYFAYLDTVKSKGVSNIVGIADRFGVEVGIFRF